jgi:hypothetical protein
VKANKSDPGRKPPPPICSATLVLSFDYYNKFIILAPSCLSAAPSTLARFLPLSRRVARLSSLLELRCVCSAARKTLFPTLLLSFVLSARSSADPWVYWFLASFQLTTLSKKRTQHLTRSASAYIVSFIQTVYVPQARFLRARLLSDLLQATVH